MVKAVLFIHILLAIFWIGGMIYTLLFLHPVAKELKEEERKKLARKVQGRFFIGVWGAILGLLITGFYLWHGYRPDFSENGLFHLKLLIFFIMFLNFSYIHAFLYRKGKFKDIPVFIWINLIFGIAVVGIITFIR